MAKDYIPLGDVAARDVAMIDIRCSRCHRHGRLSVNRLMARYGPDESVRQIMQAQIGECRTGTARSGASCSVSFKATRGRKILAAEEVKPHKVRYYLENRDAEFEAKMAEVLCVYRQVKILKEQTAAKAKVPPDPQLAVVSYDEKPGIQATENTAPDLPPVPGVHPTFARDHEYKRHGTVSLLAGIDLLSGQVHALVRDRHRSREFVEFLKLLNAAYPITTVIHLILDNHSAHISKETKAWLAAQPDGRFKFTFTPKHGSWLNLVEGFFSKLARSALRQIRVASKQELKDRIMAAIELINRDPVVHTWSYMLEKSA